MNAGVPEAPGPRPPTPRAVVSGPATRWQDGRLHPAGGAALAPLTVARRHAVCDHRLGSRSLHSGEMLVNV